MTRDERQRAVYRWVLETFGRENATIQERVRRLVEEVVELAQAENVAPENLYALIRHVYSKPKGEPAQEVGGVGTTLLAYAQARNISADRAEKAELERVLALPAEHFRERHNLKAAAGIAERAPEGTKT